MFDVIIGNPPYQKPDNGYGRSAIPIYPEFIRMAKKINPRFIVMIVPSKWFSGGRTHLIKFRSEMLNDDRIRKIVDYENVTTVFPEMNFVGGICYFLWDREYHGECEIVNIEDDSIATRPLNEFPMLVRRNLAIPIIKKVLSKDGKYRISEFMLPQNPFRIRGDYRPRETGIPCWFRNPIGLKYVDPEDVRDVFNVLDKWKVLIPATNLSGTETYKYQRRVFYPGNVTIAKPGECCTESRMIIGAFDSREEAENFASYLLTKTVGFLSSQVQVSSGMCRKDFLFVPHLEKYDRKYTDEYLCKRWGITDDEFKYICSRIR